MIVGSFVYALLSRNFRIETFTDRSDMCNHLIGAVLMGFGGVLAMGCTIGQGVSGVSTLAAGSFIAMICIVIGCALTLKVQYHMMDDCGFWRALFRGAGELLGEQQTGQMQQIGFSLYTEMLGQAVVPL